MNLNLNLPSNIKVETEKDSLGGRVLDTNVYSGKIEVAYLDSAESGAMSINIHFKTNNQVVKQTTYISNKAGEFTYKDKASGEARALPGYTEMTSFFQATTNKSISEQTTEEKVVKVYDSKAKAEVPKKVKVFSEVTGIAIAIGILKISEEKTVIGDNNIYVGTGEFRDTNKFDKYFNAYNGLTNVEKIAGETIPAFLEKWKSAKVGKVITKKAKVSGVPSNGSTNTPETSGVDTPKLFG